MCDGLKIFVCVCDRDRVGGRDEGWRVVGVVVGGGVICLPECLQFCFFSGGCLPLPFACLQISNKRLRNKVSRPDEGAVRRRRETRTRRGRRHLMG